MSRVTFTVVVGTGFLCSTMGCSKTERDYAGNTGGATPEGGNTSGPNTGRGGSPAQGGSSAADSNSEVQSGGSLETTDAQGGNVSTGGSSETTDAQGGNVSTGGSSAEASSRNGGAGGNLDTSVGGTSPANGGAGGDGSASTEGGSTSCSTAAIADGPYCTSNNESAYTDGCGSQVILETCIAASENGLCTQGACACADGFAGESCELCVAFVDAAATGDASALSWDNAATTLQGGLDVAKSRYGTDDCDSVEVWVAQGTYYPTRDASGGEVENSRSNVLILDTPMALYGGFIGTERQREERLPSLQVTTLTGDSLGNAEANTADDAYTILYVTDDVTIDGFLFTYANNDGEASDSDGKGGGIHIEGTNSVVNDCQFKNNIAYNGGGIYVFGGAPTISNCVFENNVSTTYSYGAGAIELYNASATIQGCSFSGNSSSGSSGAICIRGGGAPQISGSSFSKNTSVYDGGAISGFSFDSLSVKNCTFFDNTSDASAGAIFLSSGGTTEIISSVFAGNEGTSVGAVSAYVDPLLDVYNCTFYDNSITDAEGTTALYTSSTSTASVANGIFWNNDAPNETSTQPDLAGDSLSAQYCLMEHSLGDSNLGHLYEAPSFVNAGAYNFRLTSTSPGVDAANGTLAPTTDIEGNSRKNLTTRDDYGTGSITYADMGAYEYQP